MPLLLAALVWLSCSWFAQQSANPNNSTRLFAAISLAEQHDATIDEFAPLTVDKAKFGDHFYLDKAPGMTLAAVPAVAIADAVTGQTAMPLAKSLDDPALRDFLKLRLRAAVTLGPAILTALAALALLSIGTAMTGSRAAGLFGALGYALATPAWGWSTGLFGHAPVAALWIIACWAIWHGTRERASARHALIAGAFLGWSVVVEFQAVLGALVIGLWALWRLRGRAGQAHAIAAAVTGGMIAVVPMIGYNLLAFGEPIRLGYAGVVGFEGMQQGFFGLTYPRPLVLAQLLLGTRKGLLWVAPILLLAPFGLRRLVRDPATRDLGVMAIAVVGVVLLVNASYAYWDGGFSTGPRHSLPALPFMALGLAPFWTSLGTASARAATVALAALSAAINLAIAATDVTVPEWFVFPLWHPILADDVANGQFRDLPSALWGWSPWAGTGLYLVLAGALAYALLAAVRADPSS